MRAIIARILILIFYTQSILPLSYSATLDLGCPGIFKQGIPHPSKVESIILGDPGVGYDKVRLGDGTEHVLLDLQSIPTGTEIADRFAGCTSCGVVFIAKADKHGAKHCPSCGNPKDDEKTVGIFLPDGNKILFDGAIYKDKELAAKMQVKGEHSCPSCKSMVPNAFDTCPNCGTDHTKHTKVTSDPPRPQSKKSDSKMGAIIGGIVVVGGIAVFMSWAFTAKEEEAMVDDVKWQHNVNAKRFTKVINTGFVEDLNESPTTFPNQENGIQGRSGFRIVPGTYEKKLVGYHTKIVEDKSRPIYPKKTIKDLSSNGDSSTVIEVEVDDTSNGPIGYEKKTVDDTSRPIYKTQCEYETWEWQSVPSLSQKLSTSGNKASGVEPFWKDIDYSDKMLWFEKSSSYTAKVAYKNSKNSVVAKEFSLNGGLQEYKSLNITDIMKLEVYNMGSVKSYKKIKSSDLKAEKE